MIKSKLSHTGFTSSGITVATIHLSLVAAFGYIRSEASAHNDTTVTVSNADVAIVNACGETCRLAMLLQTQRN